jgi:adenine-specific DNA methylase
MYGIETSEWEKYITPPLEKAKTIAEEQGLPFSERMSDGADDTVEPFTVDGSMTLEDFRQAQESQLENENISLTQPETIHLYKLGDFYEMYGDDAKLAAENLDLTLTSKEIDGQKIPVVGVPKHTLQDYTQKLWDSGFATEVNDEKYPLLDKIVDKVVAENKIETSNFKMSDTEIEKLSSKEKYRNNVSAIKALLNIESEKRQATLEEQETLSKYIGWGGLADAFDESKSAWKDEYTELKELLADDEYKAARSSTLNAHYTSPAVINAMYKTLESLGFEGGKILEPAVGNGRFFGCIPDTLSDNTKLYGVELDSITGRIAKQLYPNADIQVKGFEKTAFQSNSFDVAIGNVPFGNYRVNDADFKNNDLIHDYFFKKSLDKVRPGGVVAFITSKGTLDKQDNSVRKHLAERADLLGAIRLPNNAFSEANTEVTSDIIFLQKRDMPLDFSKDEMPSWVNLAVNESNIEMNSYFVENPQMILGEMTEVSGRFGMETTCQPLPDAELSDLLDNAIPNIKGQITENYSAVEVQTEGKSDIQPENYRNFCYAVIDNDIYFRENGNMTKQSFDKTKTKRMKGMIDISETLRELMTYQKEMCSDDVLQELQAKLNSKYEDFTNKFGLLTDKTNKSLFREDDTSALLLSLEKLNDKGELVGKADIFTKRTIMPYIPI